MKHNPSSLQGYLCPFLLSVFLFSFFPSTLSAREITPAEAVTAAQNWLRRSPAPMGAKLVPLETPEVRTATDDSGRALFHMVKVDGGTVVTSTDDALTPVIAFTESESIPETPENPLWAVLVSGATSRMDSLEASRRAASVRPAPQGGGPVSTAESEWEVLLVGGEGLRSNDGAIMALDNGVEYLSDIRVNPLLDSEWGQQRDIYNYYVPNKYPCGCVATAIAQVMYYHRYPDYSVARVSRTCEVNGSSRTMTMKGGVYNWHNMVSKPLIEGVSTSQRQEIGKLCFDVGVSVSMNWASGGSGAFLSDVLDALPNIFGYGNITGRTTADNISDADTARVLCSNFDASLPVLIGIQGHAIVGDGYGYQGGNLYVHLNLGWDGDCNAWYHLPVVDCSSSGYYSSTFQNVFYNISPRATGVLLTGRVLDSNRRPVPGATVQATGGGRTLSTSSNGRGIYSFWVSPEVSYRLTATADGCQGTLSSVVVPDAISTEYGVGTYNPYSGQFGNSPGNDITLSGTHVSRPSNDDFANAAALSGRSGQVTGSNRNATSEPGEPDLCNWGSSVSVWWKWTSPVTGRATFSTSGSSIDTLLGVYTGTRVSSLTTIASDDDGGDWPTSLCTFDAKRGTTYYIAVSAYQNATGDIRLSYSVEGDEPPPVSRPPNDDFSNATTLSGRSGQVTGSNRNATSEPGEPYHCDYGSNVSVWWKWTSPVTGRATFHTSGSSIDTLLGVYTGSSVSSLTTIASDDDGGGDRTSSCSFDAHCGTTYYIAVSAYLDETGDIRLSYSVEGDEPPPVSRPPNDDFASATTLSGRSGQVTGSNRNATGESGEPDHGGRSSSVSIWWKWTSPITGRATFHTGGSSIDTLMGVYTGTRVSSLTTIASNDDSGGNLTSSCSFDTYQGTTYYIAVSAYQDAMGDIRLSYSAEGDEPPPPSGLDPIAYYPFDQSIRDVSGHGNHLRAFGDGSIAWRTGKAGSACHFDGTAQLGGACGNIAESRGSFTIAFWVRPEKNIVDGFQQNDWLSYELWNADTPFAIYPSHGGNQPPAGTGVAVGKNGIAVVEHTGNYFPVTIAYHASLGGRWTHVAVTVSANGPHQLYVNGQKAATGLDGGGRERFVRITSNTGIGGNPKWCFAGDLDEFMIFDRALSASEVRSIYANPGGVGGGPVPCSIGGDPAHPLRPGDGPGVEFIGNTFAVRFRAPEQGRRYILESATDLRGPFRDTGVSKTSSYVDELIELVDRNNPHAYRLHYYRIRIE